MLHEFAGASGRRLQPRATVAKQHRRQLEVCDDICQQIRTAPRQLPGLWPRLLREGTQKLSAVNR